MNVLLQRLRADLLERRLWPIALLLVVALVAVPLLARHSASAAPEASGAAPAVDASGAVVAAERVLGTTVPSSPQGPARDPFPSASKGATGTAKASGGGGGSAKSGAGSGASASAGSSSAQPAGSGSAPASTPTRAASASKPATAAPSVSPHRAKPKTWTIRYVDLRVGADASAPVRRGVARLAPLPSGGAPVALMLGVLQDGKAVAFRLTVGVAASGDGRCVPEKAVCTQLVLRPGQHADLTAPSGQPVRLEVVGIRQARTTSSARARQAYRRVSPAGRCILDTLLAYDFDPATGVLRRAGDAKPCRYAAADPGAAGARAADTASEARRAVR